MDRDISNSYVGTVETVHTGMNDCPKTVWSDVGTVHDTTCVSFMSFGSCIFSPGMVLPDSDLNWTLFQFPLRVQL